MRRLWQTTSLRSPSRRAESAVSASSSPGGQAGPFRLEFAGIRAVR